MSRRPSWQEEADAYLAASGWERAGADAQGRTRWRDASIAGQQDELKVSARLPVQGGGIEVVEQWHLPPTPWVYGTEEALAVQRGRDQSRETLDQLIARKYEEIDALERRRAELARG